MPTVVASTWSEGPAQADGRRYVTERHSTDDGQVLAFEWLGSQDPGPVVAARAEALNAEFAAKAAADALIAGTALPLTRLEFLSRFTVAERVAIRSAAKTDAIIEDFLAMLEAAQSVIPSHPDTVAGVGYLVQSGLLLPARAAEVLA